MAVSRRSAVLALVLLAGGCASRRPLAPAVETSGFLDDYSLLRPGDPGELSLVYRNPKAAWPSYDAVLIEPVAVWWSGRKALDAVPEQDLRRLASDFEGALRRRLGDDFRVVDVAGPGVMQIRLAVTNAKGTDPVLDIFTAKDGPDAELAPDGPLGAEMRRFLEGAVIEGEIRDAATGELLAQGLDRRRRPGSLEGVVDTWADVDRALGFWVDRVSARLEKRTQGR
jgi:hypothetical protein